MFTLRSLSASCFVIVCLFLTVLAQGEQPGKVTQTSSTVTAAAAAERVRFTAPNNVVRMQLQVISESGQILFDVSSKGNVLDWSLQDGSGQRLQGSYLTVVTVKSLSGRLSERIGSVSIGEKQVELQRADATQLTAAQQQAVGPIEENATFTILKADEAEATTVLANNGSEGQIIRERGALSFRLGNFFSGADVEQMRLTEEGNLGIGTSKPKTTLDVAGTIRAREGFMFSDGSTLKVNEKGVLTRTRADGSAPDSVSSTQNRIAKFTDSAGTLGDSSLTDAGGNVGLGVTSPGDLLDIAGAPNGSGRSGIHVRTTTSTGNATLYFDNDRGGFAAYGGVLTGGSGNPFTFFGVTRADKTFLIADGASSLGLGIGTLVPKPVILGTDNVERMRIDSSGNVGIGTTVPGAKLDVSGSINTSTRYNIGGNHALSAPGLNNLFAGSTAGASNTSGDENAFFGVSAGNNNLDGHFNSFVGVGAGFNNTTGNLNTALGYLANVGSNTLTNATAIGAQARVNTSNSLVLGSVNGVNSATANTNVGIGINAPSATLHVVSYTNSSGENTATFQAPNIGSNQSHIHYGTTGDWYIRSASTAGRVILQDTVGNVGIGTGSPSRKLDVRDGTGASGTGASIQIGAPVASADDKIIVFGNWQADTSTTPFVYIGEKDVDDRLVLGAGNGGFRFKSVAAGVSVSPHNDDVLYLGEATNRWSAVYAVNGTIQTSDVRLKRGITNLKYGLSQVMQLRPVSFQWKAGNDNRTHLGLIAQEVDAVLPEAVEKNADANAPLGMNYSTLIPVLIKAIQEQQRTLKRTQAELKAMRAKNEVLSRRIIAIEATSTVAKSTKKAQ
jgi:Chaperone of endosialidase